MAIVATVQAQEQIVPPDINYAGTPRDLVIGGFSVSGIDGYEDYMLSSVFSSTCCSVLPKRRCRDW